MRGRTVAKQAGGLHVVITFLQYRMSSRSRSKPSNTLRASSSTFSQPLSFKARTDRRRGGCVSSCSRASVSTREQKAKV
eukprot:scaffold356448_cov15-Prasinocladus_malaysianus.AAC.1